MNVNCVEAFIIHCYGHVSVLIVCTFFCSFSWTPSFFILFIHVYFLCETQLATHYHSSLFFSRWFISVRFKVSPRKQLLVCSCQLPSLLWNTKCCVRFLRIQWSNYRNQLCPQRLYQHRFQALKYYIPEWVFHLGLVMYWHAVHIKLVVVYHILSCTGTWFY